mmetsp:Transcript_884/g.1139  ORF Transcript_884/g.1139 Transcript_884/m.1139 type:complete len:329 (-) Transcript_884:179-1165(-)
MQPSRNNSERLPGCNNNKLLRKRQIDKNNRRRQTNQEIITFDHGCVPKDYVDKAMRCADRVDQCLFRAFCCCGKGGGTQKKREKRRNGRKSYWNDPFVVFFWAFVTCSATFTGLQAYPEYYHNSGSEPSVYYYRKQLGHQILHYYFLFMILGNYFFIRKLSRKNIVKLEVEGGTQRTGKEGSWCSICHTHRPTRSHHCRFCGRCILKRGHHCYFTQTCIGLHNQKHFAALILHQFMGIWTQNWILTKTARNLRANPSVLLWWMFYISSLFSGIFITYLFIRLWGSLLLGATETEMAKFEIAEVWKSKTAQERIEELKAVFGRYVSGAG